MKNQGKKKNWVRRFTQIFFFVLIALISLNRTLSESGIEIPLLSSASLHTLCPFGGVVSVYQFITTGTFVKKIHESALILMVLSFLLAILFGPILCGWFCPLGSIQEWFSKIGRKIFKKKFNRFIPYKIDKYLRFLRYGALAWVIYITATSATLVFSDYDPYNALFNLWSSELSLIGLGILVLTLVLSLFVERPWCKYVCPYGALLGITNLFRIFKIKRNSTSCTSCELCDNACPMNIKVSNSVSVRNHQCISCLVCTSEEACPIDNTVEFSTKKNQEEVVNSEN